MKIKFTQYLYPEGWDFNRIICDTGYAHDVNGEEVLERVWDTGTRELAVHLELETDTGVITVVGQETS